MSKGLQIALTGKMRSGKDTVGKYLIDKYAFNRFAFGDGIMKTLTKLFPEQCESGKPRKLLQDFGQFCTGIEKDVWVNYLFREMLWHGIDPVTDHVVITDLRQPHEYKKLKESGFTIIRVSCPEVMRMDRILTSGDNVSINQFYHETESFVDTFEVDYEIQNVGSLDLLYSQIEIILDDIGGFR